MSVSAKKVEKMMDEMHLAGFIEMQPDRQNYKLTGFYFRQLTKEMKDFPILDNESPSDFMIRIIAAAVVHSLNRKFTFKELAAYVELLRESMKMIAKNTNQAFVLAWLTDPTTE